MKIYTKQGDQGSTQIFTKALSRVDKDDTILQCYGDLDELNSHVGLLVAMLQQHPEMSDASSCAAQLQQIQATLFQIGFAISDTPQLSVDSVSDLEQHIDRMQNQLPAQTKFILPGGSLLAAQAHVCRASCRRAERSLVSVAKVHAVPNICLQYTNRLSDYLFVSARYFNSLTDVADIQV